MLGIPVIFLAYLIGLLTNSGLFVAFFVGGLYFLAEGGLARVLLGIGLFLAMILIIGFCIHWIYVKLGRKYHVMLLTYIVIGGLFFIQAKLHMDI